MMIFFLRESAEERGRERQKERKQCYIVFLTLDTPCCQVKVTRRHSPTTHPSIRSLDSPLCFLSCCCLGVLLQQNFLKLTYCYDLPKPYLLIVTFGFIRNTLFTCTSPKGTHWVGQSVSELGERYLMLSLDVPPSKISLSIEDLVRDILGAGAVQCLELTHQNS